MIVILWKNILFIFLSFRLLNSEIGNDQDLYQKSCLKLPFCFRLLNSEIGNDQNEV